MARFHIPDAEAIADGRTSDVALAGLTLDSPLP